MSEIISYLKQQIKRPGSLQLIGAGLILLTIAAGIGIADNLPGVILALVGVTLNFFAFVHHWREAGQFGTLLAVSVISLPVLILLYNVFDTLNEQVGIVPVLNQFLEGLTVISFLGAVFLAPAGAVIGLFAGLFYLVKSRFE